MKLVIDIDEELYAAGFERPFTEKEKKIFLVAIGKGIILPNTFIFCTDAVSRQAVLDYIYNDLGLGDEENGKDLERQMELEDSYRYIKSLPPVKQEPKTGHWIKYGKLYQCSECKELSCCQGKFCNECGAKMVESQESEEV